MAFVNQIQQATFFPQNLKSLRVLCQQCVQETGDVIIPLPTVPALADIVNVTVVPTGNPEIRTTTVLPGKVVNMGVVPVSVTITILGVVLPITIPLIEIPFEGIVECPGAQPGDIVQKHDIALEAVVSQPVQLLPVVGEALVVGLELQAIVKACIVVGREEVLTVNAANPFCNCP
ncbi:hypothetical protein HM1_0026 [Heliomicrobium modesticaldum Ice1]|uniref:SipL SPOCS domain-containing protein n=1 Tax=Heliobacterium modesticaldum (strain ATCC 51547 / Ice1) TaxID=498761 RepID=B0THX8_HELMI|nr:hypothetical protein [Heliomicrobium modesticaldum]ABZ82651.1 hypothetical protein HM1_0026 [Heliomicrobium modesticaldum Ice1]